MDRVRAMWAVAAMAAMLSTALPSAEVFAQTARPGDAAATVQVHRQIDRLLSQFLGASGAVGYQSIDVARTGAGFDFAILDLRLHRADGGAHTFGTVRGRLTPAGSRYDDVTLTLPESWPYRDEAGRGGTVQLGRQRIAIRWDRVLRASTSFDLEFGDITFTGDATTDLLMRADEISARSAMEDEDGLWSGPLRFRMRGVELTGNGARMHLENVRLAVDLQRADLLRLAAARDANQATGERGSTAVAEKPLMAGMQLAIEMRDVGFQTPEQDQVRLADVSYRLALSGADQPRFDTRIDVAHNGLLATGQYAFWKLLELRLQVLIEQIRSAELSRGVLASGLDLALPGGDAKDRDDEALPRFVAALAQAASTIRLEGEQTPAPGLDASYDGAFQADPEAVYGWIGRLRVRITDPAADGQEPHPDAMRYLTMIRPMGEPVNDGTALLYRFELRADGRVDLNGRPLLPAPAPQPHDPVQ